MSRLLGELPIVEFSPPRAGEFRSSRRLGFRSLRQVLREATGDSHEALDRAMSACDWTRRDGYRQFLLIQHAARQPIERWIAANVSVEAAPPPQCHLIERDLRALDADCAEAQREFEMPPGADPLGLAWALAGSSLGNRAILADIRKRADGELPADFLADPRMADFWRALRPQLERPADEATGEAAVLAAEAVFGHFLAIARPAARELAA